MLKNSHWRLVLADYLPCPAWRSKHCQAGKANSAVSRFSSKEQSLLCHFSHRYSNVSGASAFVFQTVWEPLAPQPGQYLACSHMLTRSTQLVQCPSPPVSVSDWSIILSNWKFVLKPIIQSKLIQPRMTFYSGPWPSRAVMKNKPEWVQVKHSEDLQVTFKTACLSL